MTTPAPTDHKGLNPAALNRPIESDTIRLIPATLEHARNMAQIINASQEARQTFDLFTLPPDTPDEPGCHAYLHRLISHPNTYPFSLIHKQTGELIGGTSYCDIRTTHRGLEIGWTWITPIHRNTTVNPEMKLALLTRAFENDIFHTGSAIRVQLKTHHRNIRSQRAIAALGAKLEGILRNHVIMPSGEQRHTVSYAITKSDWPTVKQRLQTRLANPRSTTLT